LAAIEEAVVNAVHHRDYRSEQPTKVYLYPNELTITSYPGPVPGLSREDFTRGKRIPQVPARNRRVGELLKELKLAETRSTGVPKIFRAMRDNGSPEPSFEFDEGRTYFTVVLPIHPESLPERNITMELLAARDAAEALARGAQPDSLTTLELSPLLAEFLVGLAGREKAVAWAREALGGASGVARKNALLILERTGELNP
jgi:ATP-dependent DNA helicase RecG